MIQHQSPPLKQEASSRATDHRPRRGSATVYSPPGSTHIQSYPIHWPETDASAANQGGEEILTLPFMDYPTKQEQEQEVLTSPLHNTLIRSHSMSMINRRGSFSSNDEEEKQVDASLAAALEASSNHNNNTLEEAISKKEAETCWFTFKECKQMKADTSSYAFRSARYLANQDPNEMQNALAMGYKTCCETLEPLTKAQVGLIKKCLEQSRSTGLEQVLIESIKLISHDKKLRRQKMLAMVAYRSTISAELSEDEQAEMVRQKCAELSRPGELFALAIGQAQQQQQQVHRSGESGHTKAARRPSLWDRLRA